MSKANNPINTAISHMLEPVGLDEGHLTTTLGSMMQGGVDYADLYFQYSRSEGWSLEDGIVKIGSCNIEQGVSVRAISGEKSAFAYSDDIRLNALESAARATRAIARQGTAGEAGLLFRRHRCWLVHRAFRRAAFISAAVWYRRAVLLSKARSITLARALGIEASRRRIGTGSSLSTTSTGSRPGGKCRG